MATVTNASKKTETEILVILNQKMDRSKWNQLRLYCHILEIGDSHRVEEMEDLLTTKCFLSQKFSNAEAVPMLHFMLACIEVEGLDELNHLSISAERKKSVAYPSVLVHICKNLTKVSYDSLKNIVCDHLGINADSITSREHLMLKLHQDCKITSVNVQCLVDWLGSISRKDIAEYVSDYQITKKSGSGSQESQPQGHGAEPTSAMSGKIRLIAEKIQVSEGDLDRRVLESDLEPIHCWVHIHYFSGKMLWINHNDLIAFSWANH